MMDICGLCTGPQSPESSRFRINLCFLERADLKRFCCTLVRCIALCMALCAPSHAETARAADYLSPDQRSRVNQLIASLDLIPTNATNAKVRADLAWEWMNAYAINGGYLPVNATLQIAQVNAAPEPNQTVLDGLDATIRELAYLDANPEGLGTLVATPGPYHANSLGTIRQTYTVGKTPIQTGGAFLLGRHFMTNFGPWQTQQPDQPNYVSIESSNPRVSSRKTVRAI